MYLHPLKVTDSMHIAIRRQSAPSKDDHLLILIESEKQIPSGYLNNQELQYVKSELKAEQKIIQLNQFNRMIFLNLLSKDEKQSMRLEKIRKQAALLHAKIKGARINKLSIISSAKSDEIFAFAEGLALAAYSFDKYKSKDSSKNKLSAISIISSNFSETDRKELENLIEAVYYTRDLVNEPQSALNATDMAKRFSAMGKNAGFKVKIFNKAEIIRMKMGGLLAVNKGSIDPPTFTVMEWKPANAVNKKPIVLVGKGVMYDTGGLSLKPTLNSMDYMKCDMAGAAAVAGAMYAVAKSRLPVHIIGLVPATDNRPSGNAFAPGDVITMMNGKTVEVMNTDAEGRLILADALHYAARYKPALILEFSTLTGAAAAVTGSYGIITMSTLNDEQKRPIVAAGDETYERLAELPLWEEFDELIKSDIADIKNVGGAIAGAITAGRFLTHFTEYPFMHFDIAGPAYSKTNDSYRGKNGTGVGVRLLFNYIKNVSRNKSVRL